MSAGAYRTIARLGDYHPGDRYRKTGGHKTPRRNEAYRALMKRLGTEEARKRIERTFVAEHAKLT